MRVINGTARRRVYGAGQDHDLDREMHSAFCQVEGADGTVPSTAIYDIRRRRQRPWSCLARRLREMRDSDTPKESTMQIVQVLALYVDRLYGDDRGSAA